MSPGPLRSKSSTSLRPAQPVSQSSVPRATPSPAPGVASTRPATQQAHNARKHSINSNLRNLKTDTHHDAEKNKVLSLPRGLVAAGWARVSTAWQRGASCVCVARTDVSMRATSKVPASKGSAWKLAAARGGGSATAAPGVDEARTSASSISAMASAHSVLSMFDTAPRLVGLCPRSTQC